MTQKPIKIMSIMAHQDDFEFNAGGLFALLRKKHGAHFQFKILATTRGASGHHEMSLDETFQRRDREARASAALIGAEYECLTGLDGKHLSGNIWLDQNTLGGLWNIVRDFEPDFIFCPPVVNNPLAGIHIDHYNTACAVRMIAYQLAVPHAYPTLNGSIKKTRCTPVIINVDDVYACENGYDYAVDISDVYPIKEKMALCHESQIFEWLPWVSARSTPTPQEFCANFRARHSVTNKRYGQADDAPREYFRLTSWCSKTTDNLNLIFAAKSL